MDYSPWGCKELDTTEHAISNRISLKAMLIAGRNLFGTFSSIPVSCWTRDMCSELLEGPFTCR